MKCCAVWALNRGAANMLIVMQRSFLRAAILGWRGGECNMTRMMHAASTALGDRLAAGIAFPR